MKLAVFLFFLYSGFLFTQENLRNEKMGTIRVVKPKETSDSINANDSISEFFIPELKRKAEYEDGRIALQMYLSQNLVYPVPALRERIEGHVWVQFIVDKEGRILFIEEKSYSNQIFINEAIRLVSNMGNWIPARENGENIASRNLLKIEFSLSQLDLYED